MKNSAKIVAYYALNLNEYHMDLHMHDRYEIMYVVSGECTIEFENHRKSIKSNQFMLIYPNYPHKLYIEAGTPCVILNIEWEMGKGGIDLTKANEKCNYFFQTWTDKFDYKIFYDKENIAFATKDLINALEAISKDEYLIELIFIRFLLEISKADNENAHYSGIRYINKARKYIEENLLEELDVEIIAKNVGVSGYYLQSLFGKYLGKGVIGYLNDVRISKACFLLKNSNMSVNDIAFEVGYNSRQHFSYTFEKRQKMSPLAYRHLSGQSIQSDTKSMKRTNLSKNP